jgi:hypothetical protein
LAEKDPTATALYNKYQQVQMPNTQLGDLDVTALLAFLESQDSTHRAGVSAGAAAEPGTAKSHSKPTTPQGSGGT